MTRAYAAKPLAERNVCSLTLPLTMAVVERLEQEARRRGLAKTQLARRLIVEGLDRKEEMLTEVSNG